MASPYVPAHAAAFDGLGDVDALPLPQRRRGSVAGGVPLPLADSDAEDGDNGGSPAMSMGGMLSDDEAVARKALRGLAFGHQQQPSQSDRRSIGSAHSSGASSETDEEDEGDVDGAYVPSRSATALASKAASRPLDIPSNKATGAHHLAMGASSSRRASIPKNVMQQQQHQATHAHHSSALPVRAHMSSYAVAQSTSMQSNALSPAASSSSFLGRSFASAGGGDSGSAFSSATETPLASSTAGALAPSSSSFYSGFVLAPSSLPQNQALAPAVPLPLGNSSRRSSSPFVPEVALPNGGAGSATDSPDGTAPPATHGGYNFALRRSSNAAAVPLLQAQLQARNINGTGSSSNNTSPHGTLRQHLPYPAPSSLIAAPVPAASHSYTFSAAARFLPPTGLGAAVASSSYGSASTSLSSSLSPLPPRPPSTPATAAASGLYSSASFGLNNGSSSTASTSAGSTPLFDRSQYATPLPSRCRTASPAHVEEIASYEAVAACPPHEMAGSSETNVTPAPRRSMPPLRCAVPGELDEPDEDLSFQHLAVPQPMPSPGGDVGFELELEEDFGGS